MAAALCRPDGWEFRAQTGSEVARSLGGTGRLATGKSGTAELSLSVAFERDERFGSYPQGTARLLRPSKFVADKPLGLWSVEVDETPDGGLRPTAIELRLRCDTPLVLSGETVIPEGELYLSATLEAD